MSEETVYLIDDDPDIRESLVWLLQSVGLKVTTFDSALAFLDAFETGAYGCIVMDVRMPGLSGINAQKKFIENGIDLPVILISGHASIDMAVTAMNQGAVTFLEKPFDDQQLIDHVQNAIGKDRIHRNQIKALSGQRLKYDSLTKRERQVFETIVQGLSNQESADKLGISRKTVEGHRANMLAKMNAGSLPELVQVAINLGVISLKE